MIRLAAAFALTTALSAAEIALYAGGAAGFEQVWVGGMARALVDAPDQGGKAVQLTVTEVPDQSWKAQIWVLPLAADIAPGDRVTIAFTARCTAPAGASGTLKAAVGMKSAPYKQLVQKQFEIGSAWKEYVVTGEAKEALAGADARFGFTAGFQVQTIEIAGIRVVKSGS